MEQAVRTPAERLPFQCFLPVRSSWLAHRLGPTIYAARASVPIRAESLAGDLFGLEVIFLGCPHRLLVLDLGEARELTAWICRSADAANYAR